MQIILETHFKWQCFSIGGFMTVSVCICQASNCVLVYFTEFIISNTITALTLHIHVKEHFERIFIEISEI